MMNEYAFNKQNPTNSNILTDGLLQMCMGARKVAAANEAATSCTRQAPG
jgi:hypothetical protein